MVKTNWPLGPDHWHYIMLFISKKGYIWIYSFPSAVAGNLSALSNYIIHIYCIITMLYRPGLKNLVSTYLLGRVGGGTYEKYRLSGSWWDYFHNLFCGFVCFLFFCEIKHPGVFTIMRDTFTYLLPLMWRWDTMGFVCFPHPGGTAGQEITSNYTVYEWGALTLEISRWLCTRDLTAHVIPHDVDGSVWALSYIRFRYSRSSKSCAFCSHAMFSDLHSSHFLLKLLSNIHLCASL